MVRGYGKGKFKSDAQRRAVFYQYGQKGYKRNVKKFGADADYYKPKKKIENITKKKYSYYEDYFLKFTKEKVHMKPTNFTGIREDESNKYVASLVKRRDGESFVIIKPSLWNKLTEEQKKNVLKHEAIHYRFEKHDTSFKYYARKYDVPVTYNLLIGGTVKVKAKTESERKYKIIKEFKTELEARDWFENNKKELLEKYHKVQISM